jgi:hypothetical protein
MNLILLTSKRRTYEIRWFSPCPPVFLTNKTDSHDLTEILLKVALKHHKTNQPTEEMK